jgi:nucleolar complex protein 3
MHVSKEVQALRDFESTLLKGYQAYLKTLLAAASAKPSGASSSSSARLATARVAVRCMGQLLVAKPGFNYSSDLLQVGFSSCLVNQGSAAACSARV